ncbi:hypothetical protein P3T76_007657 [Phytophthora citrophthora]|uniref:Uncharacterized protein n=1 Tax=Phytophthora citrophthora TaxID=4793 RepID=A0AAD9GN53_9STRA|nr:hypothetical protein P3T76_007657 [Phytophthora citrophthora]
MSAYTDRPHALRENPNGGVAAIVKLLRNFVNYYENLIGIETQREVWALVLDVVSVLLSC